eukprot:SAG31_NODE_548_length_14222_cov_10.926574_9_plen_262_part_00
MMVRPHPIPPRPAVQPWPRVDRAVGVRGYTLATSCSAVECSSRTSPQSSNCARQSGRRALPVGSFQISHHEKKKEQNESLLADRALFVPSVCSFVCLFCLFLLFVPLFVSSVCSFYLFLPSVCSFRGKTTTRSGSRSMIRRGTTSLASHTARSPPLSTGYPMMYAPRQPSFLSLALSLNKAMTRGSARVVLPAQQRLVAPTNVRVPAEPLHEDERQAAGSAAPRRLGLHLWAERRAVLVSGRIRHNHRKSGRSVLITSTWI